MEEEQENKINNQEEQEEQKQGTKLNDAVLKSVQEKINKIIESGIQSTNIDYLYKLIDIQKDIANEQYWKKKEEFMMYRDYMRNEYDDEMYNRRGMPGRGRYGEGNYGRRGVPGTGRGRYRGDYAIDEMRENYMNYSEANEATMRGNYGAEGDMIQSVESIMKNVYEIVQELSEANSPEVEKIIKKYAKKISEM